MRSSNLALASRLALLALLGGVVTAAPAEGQLLKRVKEKAAKAVEKRITGSGEAAREAEGEEEAQRGEGTSRPAETVFVNYDFVPGERVLFYDDFAADNVGDFPRRLALKSGNMEVAEVSGVRYLRATAPGELLINLPEALPERFTLEFDFMAPGGSEHQFVYFTDRPNSPYLLFRVGEGGIEAPGGSRFVAGASDAKHGSFFPVRLMVDGKHVKVYLNGTRVANVPQVDLGRSSSIRLVVNARPDRPALFGNLRVAAGGRKLYDALATDGRVTTQGILFDTGSDRIRPESAPTLKEIGEMLREHPELRLTIEGHTDDVGDDATNQQLSERRAEAIKQLLVTEHGVDAARLEARGMGESRPAASNDTPEGRQQNRRVELVRR